MIWRTSGVGKRHRNGMDAIDRSGDWGKTCNHLSAMIGTGAIACMAGNRGTGKSQLAAVLVWESMHAMQPEDDKGGPPRYVRAMDFFLDIRACFRSTSSQAERDALELYVRPRLLVIDEMQVRGESEWEDKLLTHLIDKRYAELRDTVLISNQEIKVFAAQLGASIVDRMRECGGMMPCEWASFRGKANP